MSEQSTSGGAGFCTLLGLLFIALKLTHVITWSWIWVLAPFWLPFVIVIAIIVGAFIIATFK